jgi:hypothetical protein
LEVEILYKLVQEGVFVECVTDLGANTLHVKFKGGHVNTRSLVGQAFEELLVKVIDSNLIQRLGELRCVIHS